PPAAEVEAFADRARVAFPKLGRAQLLAPRRVERPQPADALADGRMRDEQGREALLGERVDRVERLGRRAGLELDELAGLLEADQCVCQPVRRVAELGGGGVREELAF